MSSTELEASLLYLVPGFLALSVFAALGLRSKRSDLELTLSSLLLAAVVNTIASALGFTDPTAHLWVALLLAAGGGYAAARIWDQVARDNPELRARGT